MDKKDEESIGGYPESFSSGSYMSASRDLEELPYMVQLQTKLERPRGDLWVGMG